MVKVGNRNQGMDDRYIRLLSHRPLYPGVGFASVSFDHVFETRFSNVSSRYSLELSGLLRSPCVPCAFPLLICITVESMTSCIVIT